MTAETDVPESSKQVAPPDGVEILRIDDLHVHFPIRGGLLDSLRGRSRDSLVRTSQHTAGV
jgi:hypothetical protein